MYKKLIDMGYAASNSTLMEEVEVEVREANPDYDDDKVEKEVLKILAKATLYNGKNKKPKKVKVK